ncbi:MAG: cytochrome b562 [Alkalimonas sp.]|nr:cytochrome b562 [Alkalimonas sp.]
MAAGLTHAYTSQSESLEVIMKSFSFEYRQAVESESSDVRLQHVHQMQQKIAAAKRAPLREDKADQFLQGFQKVSDVLLQVERAVMADDQQLADEKLARIDQLRIEYHRLRKRSIWQLLFGR